MTFLSCIFDSSFPGLSSHVVCIRLQLKEIRDLFLQVNRCTHYSSFIHAADALRAAANKQAGSRLARSKHQIGTLFQNAKVRRVISYTLNAKVRRVISYTLNAKVRRVISYTLNVKVRRVISYTLNAKVRRVISFKLYETCRSLLVQCLGIMSTSCTRSIIADEPVPETCSILFDLMSICVQLYQLLSLHAQKCPWKVLSISEHETFWPILPQ
jgi:hypothetical protein